MYESAEGCDSLSPYLTDSGSESDSGLEPESEQDYVIEKISIRYQPDSPYNVTNSPNAGGTGSEKDNCKNKSDLMIATRDKDINIVSYDLASSNASRELNGESTRLRLGIGQPLGMASSRNRCKKDIETVTQSRCGEHASLEKKYSPQEAYELLSTASDSSTPSLTDPESEPDSGFEPESEQEYTVKKIGIKHQIDSPPNVTVNTSKHGIESGKVEPGPELSSRPEPETNQEHVMKKVNIKHQIDLFPSITDVAGGIGSRRDNPQDDVS